VPLLARFGCVLFFTSLKLRSANMTLREVFNMSKLCNCVFALAPHSFFPARCAYYPMLFPRRWLMVSAVSQCRTETTDADSNEVNKTRTVRWLPRKKRVRFKRNLPQVVEHRSDPSSVLVDMLASRDSGSADLCDAALDTVRTEIDEKLKELEEMTSTEIRDIDLAVEMDEEQNMAEEDTEKTEV